MKPFGQQLREVRKARGMNAATLSGLSGVSKNTIWSLERGATKAPTRETIRRLAEALGVAPRVLMAGTDYLRARWEQQTPISQLRAILEGEYGLNLDEMILVPRSVLDLHREHMGHWNQIEIYNLTVYVPREGHKDG